MDHTRTNKGDCFVEGSRLIWLRLQQRKQTVWAFAKDSGLSRSSVFRWMYGDRKPGADDIEKLRVTLGIPFDAWVRPPSKPFELPASKKAA